MNDRSGDLSWPLQRAAGIRGGEVGIVDGDRRITYEELSRRTGAVGAALTGLEVAPGGRVGFLGVNSLAHVECWLGVPAANRVLVDLNFRLAPTDLAFMVEDCELEVLIVDDAQLEVALALRETCPTLRTIVQDTHGPCDASCLTYESVLAEAGPAEAAAGRTARPVTGDPDRLAVISYTGGTTGRPKGVMLSHANLLANARHNIMAVGHRPDDHWLHVCPMFHVAGTANLLACTWVGCRQTVCARFDAATVAETIEREGVTHVVLVPTMLAMLLEHLDRVGQATLPTLRHIQYAASPISPELQRRVLDRFDADIVQFYGMTEAAPTISCCTAEDHRRGHRGEEPYTRRLGSVGAPVVGVQAEVRDGDGRPAPAGEVGEIWVRGPNVMLGYWRRPEATEAALAGGWYRTGDAAHADEDGYLYVVDRLKDMIITGGENVYSIEVEQALMAHPLVLEAAVFGIPHARWGEAVHAVASVGDPAPSEEELIAHCRSLVAGYKIPRSIEVTHEPLPKSGAGKLLKQKLREPFWAEHGRLVN